MSNEKSARSHTALGYAVAGNFTEHGRAGDKANDSVITICIGETEVFSREKARLRQAAYRAAHPDEARLRAAAYRATHREAARLKGAAHYAAHREEVRLHRAAYYAAHRDEARLKSAVYYAAHREKLQARAAAYRQTSPDVVQASNARRRAHKAAAPLNDFTATQWIALQAHYDHRCVYCGKRRKGKLTQDHISPLSKGGSHTLANVVPACRSCNSRKNAGPVPMAVQPVLLLSAPLSKRKMHI